jgi:hypothetical protein
MEKTTTYNKIQTSSIQTKEQNLNNFYSYDNNNKEFNQNENKKSYLFREIAKSNPNKQQYPFFNRFNQYSVCFTNIFFYTSKEKRSR